MPKAGQMWQTKEVAWACWLPSAWKIRSKSVYPGCQSSGSEEQLELPRVVRVLTWPYLIAFFRLWLVFEWKSVNVPWQARYVVDTVGVTNNLRWAGHEHLQLSVCTLGVCPSPGRLPKTQRGDGLQHNPTIFTFDCDNWFVLSNINHNSTDQILLEIIC